MESIALLKRSILKLAYTVAPGPANRLDRWWWEGRRARALVAEAVRCNEPAALIRTVGNSMFFPEQKSSEMRRLMELLLSDPPRTVCEIGAGRGGNLFLIAQVCAPDAVLISIDIHFSFARPASLQKLGKSRQRIRCIEADSQLDATRDRVKALLSGDGLDFLFIDGDHSYAGVKRDFELYSTLVRPGGIIALHDIVPDFRSRYGKDTGTYTGEVPVFWEELKTRYQDHYEFVDDPAQDGLGIGVIRNNT